jgi:hypothetical protein
VRKGSVISTLMHRTIESRRRSSLLYFVEPIGRPGGICNEKQGRPSKVL